jgi:hypothetical protein
MPQLVITSAAVSKTVFRALIEIISETAGTILAVG